MKALTLGLGLVSLLISTSVFATCVVGVDVFSGNVAQICPGTNVGGNCVQGVDVLSGNLAQICGGTQVSLRVSPQSTNGTCYNLPDCSGSILGSNMDSNECESQGGESMADNFGYCTNF